MFLCIFLHGFFYAAFQLICVLCTLLCFNCLLGVNMMSMAWGDVANMVISFIQCTLARYWLLLFRCSSFLLQCMIMYHLYAVEE